MKITSKLCVLLVSLMLLSFSGCLSSGSSGGIFQKAEEFINKGDFSRNKVEEIFIVLPTNTSKGLVKDDFYKKKSEDFKASLNLARDNYEKAQAEISAAELSGLTDQEIDYQEQLSKLIKTRLDEIDEYRKYLDTYGQILETVVLVNEANSNFNQAREKMTLIIDNLNAQQFFEVKSQAQEARQFFEEAEGLYRDVNLINPGFGAGNALSVIAKSEVFIDNSIRLAEAGTRNDTITYNSLIQQNESLRKEITEAEKNIKAPLNNPQKWLEDNKKLQDIFTTTTKLSYQAREIERQAYKYQKSTLPWYRRIFSWVNQ